MITVMLCALGTVFEGVDLQAAGVAAAGIIPEFRPDHEHLAAFFSASTLGLMAGAIAGGRAADGIGRKRVLVATVAVFGFFSLLTACAPTMALLTGARFLTGLGLGGAFPMYVALTAESSLPERRNTNVTLVYAAMPFGGALVSLLSMLISGVHWRALFIVGGVAPLLVAPLMALYLEESRAFVGTSAVGRAQGTQRGSFVAVLSPARSLNTVLLWLGFFLGLLTLYLLVNWLPTLLLTYGLDKHQAALAQIAFNLGGAGAALGVGRLLDSARGRIGAATVFGLLPALLACLAAAPTSTALIVAIVLALGAAVLSSQAVMHALAPVCYPTEIRGVGVGTAVGVGRVGSIVGPALAGILLVRGRSSSQLFLYLVPIAVVGGLCAVWLIRRLWRRRPSTPLLKGPATAPGTAGDPSARPPAARRAGRETQARSSSAAAHG